MARAQVDKLAPALTANQFAAAVQAAIVPLADPANAAPMAAYMKGHFLFLGIKTPVRRAATRTLIRDQHETVVGSAEALWTCPEREYQYVACDLLAKHAAALPASALPKVLALVTQKSWWDTVDGLAKVAGTIVRNHPKLAARMDTLATHHNLWLRRIAILHQLGAREATDADRLFRICLANADDPEFFIRKGIGWALRDYAYHDARAVRAFLKQHRARLSPLTIREARKNL